MTNRQIVKRYLRSLQDKKPIQAILITPILPDGTVINESIMSVTKTQALAIVASQIDKALPAGYTQGWIAGAGQNTTGK